MIAAKYVNNYKTFVSLYNIYLDYKVYSVKNIRITYLCIVIRNLGNLPSDYWR